ncbi:hypothetical protein [Thermotoga sp. SG1]|uniref:hypothetical protein n=1 Tax=Thermotoga sp. SG1 TaxID=126739 RepID=UPI000C77CFA5|nr:hypothetical protein [Thermotoga sp. SG1]PLV57149.1 hypothetical protein AS006_02315 [Thermotoga sp. SG1]
MKKGFVFLGLVVAALLLVTSCVSSSSGPSIPVIKGRWESQTFTGDFDNNGTVESMKFVLVVEQQDGFSFTGRFGANSMGIDILLDITGTIDQYGYLTIRLTGFENATPLTGRYESGKIKIYYPQYGEIVLFKTS